MGATNSLLASGVYGVVKVVATSVFVLFFADSWGRKPSLFVSAVGMSTLFFILGAILKTHPPSPTPQANPPSSGKAMAAMLYIYVCFYSMGWGPVPWLYVSDIFPTRTRHYGLAIASSSQWLWSTSFLAFAQARFSSSMFPRFCSSKGDANHSHEARLQDVLHVRSPGHWSDGSVISVCLMSPYTVPDFSHTTEQHNT